MLRRGEVLAPDQQERRYEQAHARVQALKGFYVHAGAFVVINIALFVINALTGGLAGGVWWFYWPLSAGASVWGRTLWASSASAMVVVLWAGTGRNVRLGS